MSYILFDLQKIFNLIEYDAIVTINGSECVPVFDGCKYSERAWDISPNEVDALTYVYQLAAQRALGLPDVPIERDAEFLMKVICTTYKYFMDDYGISTLKSKTVETYTCILLALGVIKYIIDTVHVNTWEQIWLEKMGTGELILFVKEKNNNDDDKKNNIHQVVVEDEYTENIIRQYMNTFGRTCAINPENIDLVTECHNLSLEKCVEFNIDVGQQMVEVEENKCDNEEENYDECDNEDNYGDNELPEDVNHLEDVE